MDERHYWLFTYEEIQMANEYRNLNKQNVSDVISSYKCNYHFFVYTFCISQFCYYKYIVRS